MMNPDFTRKRLSAKAKGYTQECDDDDWLDTLQWLQEEGTDEQTIDTTCCGDLDQSS